jgi:hypothetical protein
MCVVFIHFTITKLLFYSYQYTKIDITRNCIINVNSLYTVFMKICMKHLLTIIDECTH